MEKSLDDILIDYRTKKAYKIFKLLSHNQLKELLYFKTDNETVLEICRFIYSKFNSLDMDDFLHKFLNSNTFKLLDRYYQIHESCIMFQFNIHKKYKSEIDEIKVMVENELIKLNQYDENSNLDLISINSLLEKKELSIKKFDFKKVVELKQHLSKFLNIYKIINDNQKNIKGKYAIKNTDKISIVLKKIYEHTKMEYTEQGLDKEDDNFKDILIPHIYITSHLSKLKRTRFKFDDLEIILKFIRKLFFIKILKKNNIPVKNLDLSEIYLNYILYRGSRRKNEHYCIFKMSEVRSDQNAPYHIFYKDNGNLIIANSYDDLKKLLIENLNLSEIAPYKISMTERINYLYHYSYLSRNTRNGIYSIAELLANKSVALGKILSTINYLFYINKKFFLKDYISIREDGVIFRNNNLLQLLALSNDYSIFVNGIKNLNNENEDELIEKIINTLLIDVYISIKKTSILEKKNPTTIELSNILSKNKEDYINELKIELRRLVKNFNELYQNLYNGYSDPKFLTLDNFTILIYSLLIGYEKITTNNIFCHDLYNSKNISDYDNKVTEIIMKHKNIHDFDDRAYSVKHYRYSNNIVDSSAIKLDRIYNWSIFDFIGGKLTYLENVNFCSGATTFQLLCYLVLDYTHIDRRKNNVVINKITNSVIKDFFLNTDIDNFYTDITKSFTVIEQLHKIFTSFRTKLISSLDELELGLGDKFSAASYNNGLHIMDDPFSRELPGHPLVILILLDNLFGLDVYYKKEHDILNIRDDITYQHFYNMLNSINTNIPINNTSNDSKTMKQPLITSMKKDRLSFVINEYINFYWHSGHGSTTSFQKIYQGKLRFDNFLMENVLPSKESNFEYSEFVMLYMVNDNFDIFKWFNSQIGYKAYNLLFMENISASSKDIYKFLFTTKNKDENDRRVKHILNNQYIYSHDFKYPELFTVKFDLTDYNEKDINVDYFYKDNYVYEEGVHIIPTILNNNCSLNDIIFNKKINQLIRKNINNLSPEDKIKNIIKNTSNSILNRLFLRKIFTNQKDFKKDFIKKINLEMNSLIKKVVTEVSKNYPNITENDIKFVLKGGMNFYTLYYKFLTSDGNNFPLLKKFFLETIGEDKRSDYDFTILINPNLSDEIFYYIYYLLNKKVTKKCIYYQRILEKNLHIKINLDRAAINIKQKINETFNNEGIEKKDILMVELDYYYGQHVIKSSSVVDPYFNLRIKREKQITNLDKNENMLINKKPPYKLYDFNKLPKKSNFYVTFTMNLTEEYNNLPCVKKISSEKFSVYYYANESLAFYSNEEEQKKGKEGNVNSFFLHRIKKNIKIKLEDINKNIYVSDIGIELLDIAVPNKFDFYHKSTNLLNYIEERKYNKSKIKIFNIIGLIRDYVKMFFYESEYPWTNEKYITRLDRFIILITIHNINNLEKFYNFIKAIKSRTLYNIEDETNRYIIENLINLFERTREVVSEYSTFEKNLLNRFEEIKNKINQDKSNHSIIIKVGIKDKLSKDNLSQKIKNFSLIVKDKRNGGKISLINNLMSAISQQGEWTQKLSLVKSIIDQIKEILSKDPDSFKIFENIDRRFNSLIKTISTTLYEYDETYLPDYNSVKTKETRNILRIIDSLKKSYKFYKNGLKEKIDNLIKYMNDPSSILSETSLENLLTLMNIDFNKKHSLDLEYLKKYKFKFEDIDLFIRN